MSGVNVLKQFDAEVTCVIDGEEFGPWDTWDPPEASGNTARYRAGGQRNAVRTRGLPEFGTGSLTKALVGDDELGQFKRLHRRVGVARMEVTEQPLDPNGDPFGDPVVWTGLLEQVEMSDYDADGDDNRTVTVEIAPDDGIA